MALVSTTAAAAKGTDDPRATKVSELEARLAALEAQGAGLLRVRRHCAAAVVASAVYKWVPQNYYDRPMAERAELLGCFEEQMCKALLMENVEWQPLPPELGVGEDSDLARWANSRYVCVLLQYTAKMNAEKLRKALHAHCNATLAAAAAAALGPEGAAGATNGMDGSGSGGSNGSMVPMARFTYRLAPENVSDALTGFEHNAVTPFGLRTAGIPIVLSEATLSVRPRFLYMGAGHVNCKLGCTLHDFVRALGPIVANVSDPR